MAERRKNMGKLEHDHKGTQILKVVIFSIIMLAPFLAVLTECLYMICNKNAPTNYTGTQQDVFYNAINNIATKQIFNWTTNTGMYTAINSMTTGLEFGTSANTLGILLTYWTLNTGVYVIFDIVLWCFTKLTHMFNK